MTTTIVGHQPTPHRTYRTLWEPVNGSEQNMESSITRSQALLAVCTNYCPNPEYRRVRPFLLPTKSSFDGNGNPHSHLEKSLGYGAFGVVWSVIDPRDGKKVALKRIPRVFHNRATAIRVFRELKILSNIRHDNIVSLTDIVLADSYANFDEVYFIFELMQTDLHSIIASPQSLSEDHVKIFLYQILRGLKYLHSARIIHRDIKPGNMLVNSDCLLKICDFGLARIESQSECDSLTQEVVTRYYRSPELLMECPKYTSAVDLWSVGCTFGELLKRKVLFPARNPLDQLEMIFNLIGTPTLRNIYAYPLDMVRFVFCAEPRRPNLAALKVLSTNAAEMDINLLLCLLKFNPEERLTTEEALNHPYLEEARLRFHSCMCTCCHDVPVTGPSSTQNIQMTSKPEQEKMSSSSLYASEDGLTKAIASTSRVFEASSGSVASDLSPTNSVCPPSNSLLSYTSSRHQQQHSQPVYNQHNLNNIQSNQQQQSSTQPVHSQTVSQQYSHYATHQQLASQQHSALHHSSQYQSVTQGHHNSRHSLNSSSLTPGTPEGGGIINNVGVDQQSIGYSNRTAAAGCSPDSSIAVGSSNASCGSLASEAAAVDSSSSGTVFSHAQSSGGALSPTRRIFCLDLDPICLTPPPLEMEIQFGRVVNVKKFLWDIMANYHRFHSRSSRLVLNKNAFNYKTFISANVAQVKERQIRHHWE